MIVCVMNRAFYNIYKCILVTKQQILHNEKCILVTKQQILHNEKFCRQNVIRRLQQILVPGLWQHFLSKQELVLYM